MSTTVEAPSVTPYDFPDAMPLAGVWRPGGGAEALADRNPWSGEPVADFTLATPGDVDNAYHAGQAAQPAWAALAPAQRAAVMREAAEIMTRRRDEIVGWMIRESGGTVAKSSIEWDVTRTAFLHAAGLPYRMEGRILPSDISGKEHRVYRRPVGVVGIISPWNVALYLSTRSLAPALAAGNGVVLKPAEDTPVTGGLLLARILEEAGLPAGVLSVLVGLGGEIGDAMVTHPVPRMISFTGSTAVGQGITRIAGVKRLGLELGGNAPLVVLDDADLDVAVNAAVWGSFFNHGQICMIANRIIVDDSAYDEFLERFVERVRGLRVGDPSDPATDIGPVVSVKQLTGIEDRLRRTVAAGGRVLVGGDPTGPTGLTLPPHVIVGGPDLPQRPRGDVRPRHHDPARAGRGRRALHGQ